MVWNLEQHFVAILFVAGEKVCSISKILDISMAYNIYLLSN